MKKILFTVAIVVLGLSNINAQEITFGVKAGGNFAKFGGDIEDTERLTAFHIGGVAEIALSEKFSLQPEVLFSMQGTSAEYSELVSGSVNTFESKSNLSYISVPVMAKYYIIERLSIEAGPQIGFLVSAKRDYDYTESFNGEVTYTESEDGADIKDNFHPIDFGLNFGAGYKLDNGLNFSARYNLGLVNIAKYAPDGYSTLNNVIQLSVGYSFN